MKKNEKLLSVLKGVINIIYGGLVIVSIALVLIIAFSPLFLKENVHYLTASVPVSIGLGDEPQFDVQVSGSVAKQISLAFVDEAQGVLHLETTNWYFIFVSYASKLVTAIGLAYAFYLLREVLAAIAKDEIFTAENSHKLRRLGYVVLLVGFIRPSVESMAANEILRRLSNVSPAISMPYPFKIEVIFASLLILILAQVWAYGLELKQEQDLTI
jgi:hypothetical protein